MADSGYPRFFETCLEARFHEQLWQCFVDQTWPDKEQMGRRFRSLTLWFLLYRPFQDMAR